MLDPKRWGAPTRGISTGRPAREMESVRKVPGPQPSSDAFFAANHRKALNMMRNLRCRRRRPCGVRCQASNGRRGAGAGKISMLDRRGRHAPLARGHDKRPHAVVHLSRSRGARGFLPSGNLAVALEDRQDGILMLSLHTEKAAQGRRGLLTQNLGTTFATQLFQNGEAYEPIRASDPRSCREAKLSKAWSRIRGQRRVHCRREAGSGAARSPAA